ncbi:MAG: flagellin, partial [OM182 bacterium]
DMQALNADGYDNVGGRSVTGAAKADGLDPRSATGSVTENNTVTFKTLANEDTITIGGITLTASGAMGANDVAAAFADPTAAVANGSFDKTTLSGWTAEPVSGAGNEAKVKFTSTTPDSNVDNLTVAALDSDGSGTNTAVIPTLGTAVEGAKGTSPIANESAFGDAVLYWNDNGTAKAINVDSAAAAEYAIDQLDKAILGASGERAKYGAYMSRLEHSSDNLLNVAQNTDQSRSRIEDADYAVETSELARTQIIAQAATAMLAQANQAKQGVLQLLQ